MEGFENSCGIVPLSLATLPSLSLAHTGEGSGRVQWVEVAYHPSLSEQACCWCLVSPSLCVQSCGKD